jgi:hypothetical protein
MFIGVAGRCGSGQILARADGGAQCLPSVITKQHVARDGPSGHPDWGAICQATVPPAQRPWLGSTNQEGVPTSQGDKSSQTGPEVSHTPPPGSPPPQHEADTINTHPLRRSWVLAEVTQTPRPLSWRTWSQCSSSRLRPGQVRRATRSRRRAAISAGTAAGKELPSWSTPHAPDSL